MTSSPMRFGRSRLVSVCVLGLVLAGCQSTPPAATTSPAPATGTEILWDRYGVPHIFAPDHPSLFQAYGYAQMEAHAELLVRLYAQARGRGAEFYGAQEHKAELSAEAQGVLPLTVEDVYAHGLRVIHYDWVVSPRRLEGRLARPGSPHTAPCGWASRYCGSASPNTWAGRRPPITRRNPISTASW